MRILGINALNHDAAVTVIEDGNILFAAHAERYSKIKNDEFLNQAIVDEALSYGVPDKIAYYERPWLKKCRQARAGQWSEVFGADTVPYNHIRKFGLTQPIEYVEHHLSHAAAGFYTSPFEQAAVLVMDGIGEFDTTTIWLGDASGLHKLSSFKYPKSVGLFYSAFTHLLGLKPNEEEYIMMGMAAYGDANRYYKTVVSYKDRNLHQGITDWPHAIETEQDKFDIAAAAQLAYENVFRKFLDTAYLMSGSDNIVLMGGCALNCSANRLVGEHFKNIWIMPNPGDAGSSLGAAAAVYGKKLTWTDAYLGTDIPGEYPVDILLENLLQYKIVGVASGRAEFGPRALGNRSLLADPRGNDIKDQVNAIKQRQKFRPFAPVILEEFVHEYFDMPRGWDSSRFMQTTAVAKFPNICPAVVHADGTSRVQTVARDGSGIRRLLEAWYIDTGCPMLLNTSLNVKGEPIVNDRADADRFEQLYKVKVIS